MTKEEAELLQPGDLVLYDNPTILKDLSGVLEILTDFSWWAKAGDPGLFKVQVLNPGERYGMITNLSYGYMTKL